MKRVPVTLPRSPKIPLPERADQLARRLVVAGGVAGAVDGIDHVVADHRAHDDLERGDAEEEPGDLRLAGALRHPAAERLGTSTSSTGAQMNAPQVS